MKLQVTKALYKQTEQKGTSFVFSSWFDSGYHGAGVTPGGGGGGGGEVGGGGGG